MYAFCESSLSVGIQAEAMARRKSFLNYYTHSNIQLNKVWALWKYSEWWASSRSNGFQNKFFKTLYIFTHTIEQIMRSVKIHWAVGFKQKQWPSEEVFQNTTNIQTYNRTKYALCESTLSGGLQAEVMAFRKSFSKRYTLSNIQLNRICTLWKYSECWASSTSKGFLKKHFETLKHYTHSNIQLNKVCILWNYTEWWASSRSNRFQRFFKTLYTFKHTIEQCMRSVKVHWVVGFKQKQWLAEEVFWIIIHIQTYNWTKYALCESTVSGGLQAEAMGFRRSFLKHCTHSNLQLNKVCILWKYTEWWASSRSNGFHKKFFKSLYIFKHTIQQRMLSVKVHWVVGFKQKQWLAEEVFWNIIHIQTYNWTKYALCESTVSSGLQAEAMGFRSFSKRYTHSNIQLNNVCALWKFTDWWDSSRSNGSQKKFFETL